MYRKHIEASIQCIYRKHTCLGSRPIRLAGCAPFDLSIWILRLGFLFSVVRTQWYAPPGSRTILLYSSSVNNQQCRQQQDTSQAAGRRWWIAASGRAGGCSGAPPGCSTGSVERFNWKHNPGNKLAQYLTFIHFNEIREITPISFTKDECLIVTLRPLQIFS